MKEKTTTNYLEKTLLGCTAQLTGDFHMITEVRGPGNKTTSLIWHSKQCVICSPDLFAFVFVALLLLFKFIHRCAQSVPCRGLSSKQILLRKYFYCYFSVLHVSLILKWPKIHLSDLIFFQSFYDNNYYTVSKYLPKGNSFEWNLAYVLCPNYVIKFIQQYSVWVGYKLSTTQRIKDLSHMLYANIEMFC